MKKRILLLACSLLGLTSVANATINSFVSGSTGANGAFNPSVNTVVTLPANGVLNYTTINIPAGVTVTFTPNAANTPVYMLATGNVTIAGVINVNGANGTSTAPGAGGPGGFAGGYSCNPYAVVGGSGLGPGGGPGSGATTTPTTGIHGSYAGMGSNNSPSSTYGNAQIMPLIGGSGGSGGYASSATTQTYQNGGGGGGAILIASSGTITHTGTIYAKGGVSAYYGGTGSAGAIKLMANTITGTGTLDASSTTGGYGRIRLETYNLTLYGTSTPAFTFGAPGSVFGSLPPSLTITSIGGTAVPTSATGSYTTPDIILPSSTTNPVSVGISATNVPVGTTINLKVVPQTWKTTTIATDLPVVTTTLSGTDASSSGTASVTIPTTCTTVGTMCTSVIQVQATFTVVAFNYQGEEINQIRVATATDGKSETFYISKNGKEFKVS